MFADLVRNILSLLKQTFTGSSLARIAVEVGSEKDVKLLVKSGTVDWNETVGNEDAAIMWALVSDKPGLVQRLLEVPGINLDIKDKEGWSLVARAISKKDMGKLSHRKTLTNSRLRPGEQNIGKAGSGRDWEDSRPHCSGDGR